MAYLAALIEQQADSHPRLLEQAIFDSNDPEVVAAEIESYVQSHLGAVIDALFYSASVGIVAGLRLASGDDVVVKVQHWNVSVNRLRDVQRIQAHLFAAGLPAPRPLARPMPLGNGLVVIEEMRRGDVANGHIPAIRARHSFFSSVVTSCGQIPTTYDSTSKERQLARSGLMALVAGQGFGSPASQATSQSAILTGGSKILDLLMALSLRSTTGIRSRLRPNP